VPVFDIQLRRVAADQGVFLRREAHALGFDDKAVQRAYRAGAWVRVHHGCYTFKDVWDAADAAERHRIQSRAVLRTHGDDAVLSHISAVVEHQVDVWGVDLDRTHVTMTAGSSRVTDRVRHHVGACGAGDTEVVNSVRATVLPRAIIETASVESTESGLVLADSGMHRRLVTPDDLARAYGRMEDWPGARHAGLVVRLADPGAESVGESRSRYLMWSEGIPLPQLQYAVYDGRGQLVGTTDFAWPKYGLLGEFDGKMKYGRLLRPGEEPGDAVFREKRREELLCELTGWRMIRLAWADLYDPIHTAMRIRRMLRHAA
jgi:hypothetical protein